MNILLINHYAGSVKHGMEYRPYYFARDWVLRGHHVTIAAASHSHVRQIVPEFGGASCEEYIDGIRYMWLKTPRYDGNGSRRAVNMFAFVAQLYRQQRKLSAGRQFDSVVASSTYPLDMYPARRIARRHRAKLVFEVHDLWPLSPIELGGMSPRHPFIRIMQRAEDYAYRYSDRVVSLLPNADSHMRSRGMQPEKFTHIPNGINVDSWQSLDAPLPEDHRKILGNLRDSGKFVVGYAGAFGIANSLDSLVEAAQLLKSSRAVIVLVGDGPEKHNLKQLAEKLHLDNVVFLPRIPRNSVPAFLAMTDVTYIGLKRCSLFRFGISPNKIMDYMMAGKPIIQAIDAGNNIVGDVGCGLSAIPENAAESARAIRTLMELSMSERERMGARGQRYVTTRHNYPVLAEQFLQVLKGGDSKQTATPLSYQPGTNSMGETPNSSREAA